jgi:hypothetical protein
LAAGLTGALTGLLYLPVILVSGLESLVANRFVLPLSWTDFFEQLPAWLASIWALWMRDVPLTVVLLLVAGFVGATMLPPRRAAPLALAALLACAPLLLAQHVLPFPRTWLFLLPLFWIVASAGLAAPLERLRLPGAPVAVAVALWLGGLVAVGPAIPRSEETGSFPDAEPIAAFLVGRLAPDESVLTAMPASLPELQYYFRRDGLDPGRLTPAGRPVGRLYVIAPAEAADPLRALAAVGGPSLASAAPPRAVARFATSTLYELESS